MPVNDTSGRRPAFRDEPWLCERITCTAPSHDNVFGYKAGCRSGAALHDSNRYVKTGRAGIRPPRMISAVGSTRRLQALVALGYTNAELAGRLNLTRPHLTQLVLGNRLEVREVTRQAVRAVYDELGSTPGTNVKARKRGERRGWPVPLMWDDDVIDDPNGQPATVVRERHIIDEVKVQRALAGKTRLGDLNPVERDVAVLRTTSWSAALLAERLHCTERTVVRIRARLRAAAEAPREAA